MKQITMTHKRRANKISFLTDAIDTKFSRKKLQVKRWYGCCEVQIENVT